MRRDLRGRPGRFPPRATLLVALAASLGLNAVLLSGWGAVFARAPGATAVSGESDAGIRLDPAAQAKIAGAIADLRLRTAAASQRAEATALAEALPVIGAGAVAASRALEMADACAHLRDLRAIERAVNPAAPPAPLTCADELERHAQTGSGILARLQAAPGAICRSARGHAGAAVNADLPGWADRTLRYLAALCPGETKLAASG